MPYEEQARTFYLRLEPAVLATDRAAFEAQIADTRIEWLDVGHDQLELPSDFKGPKMSESAAVIDAVYKDADGADVNVIVHLVDGRLSWAERYRNLGEPIIQWPPAENAELRFPRYSK